MIALACRDLLDSQILNSCTIRDERAIAYTIWNRWIASRGFGPAPVPRSCPVKTVAGKIPGDWG